MSYSATEIASLAQKAARGAGFPPGQAEVFGRAAALHLASGRDPQALEQALNDPVDSPILRLPLLMEDIQRALRLAGPEIALTLQPGDEGLAETYARLLPIRISDFRIDRGDDGLPRLTVTGDPETPETPDLPARITAPTGLIDVLTRLAARTYVPASEASSSAGAGADDIDND